MTKTAKNRSSFDVASISIKRHPHHVIEYTMTMQDGYQYEMHANREVTFHGPYTGRGGARQVSGGASTLWRETDAAMLKAFKRAFPTALVTIN